MNKKKDRQHYTAPVRTVSRADCEQLVRMALAEDMPEGDPTSEAIFDQGAQGKARVVAREPGLLCGLPVVGVLLDIHAEQSGRRILLQAIPDGTLFEPGSVLAELSGSLRDLLSLERTLLNFLQYLSGIATEVSKAVQLAGDSIAVLDTRKTIPGYRRLAKYAVYCGGGTNHRINLSEMAMIKDNHIAAAGSIEQAVALVRGYRPGIPLEVEVDNLEQLERVLPLQPDVVLLDNMDAAGVAQAMKQIGKSARGHGRLLVEVSGGWTPERLIELHGLGEIGVSMGALTHTTRFLDLSLEVEPVSPGP